MKKKIYIPFFMLIIIFNAWWFLNRESTPPPQEGVLDVWVTWSDSPDQLQTLFDRFSQLEGQSIQITTQVREDDLLDALSSDQPPDLVILSTNQAIQTYADQGRIGALDTWIEASPGIQHQASVGVVATSPNYASDGELLLSARWNGLLLSTDDGDNWSYANGDLTEPGNAIRGISLQGGASDNLIGGTAPGEGNLVSNNGNEGIVL